jgi:hypothetical protein
VLTGIKKLQVRANKLIGKGYRATNAPETQSNELLMLYARLESVLIEKELLVKEKQVFISRVQSQIDVLENYKTSFWWPIIKQKLDEIRQLIPENNPIESDSASVSSFTSSCLSSSDEEPADE